MPRRPPRLLTERQMGLSAPASAPEWMLHSGMILFAAAWGWSLVTSLSLWQQMRELNRAARDIPPEIPGDRKS